MQSCRSDIFSRTEAVVQQRRAGQSTLCSVNVQPQCQSLWVPLRGAVSRWSRQTSSSVAALGGFQLSWVVLGCFVWDEEWWGGVQGLGRFLKTLKITVALKIQYIKKCHPPVSRRLWNSIIRLGFLGLCAASPSLSLSLSYAWVCGESWHTVKARFSLPS